MITEYFSMNPENPDTEMVEKAAKIIKNGGILAFPTETVYGLGADATDANAAAKIYSAKGRPSDNPLIVHISDLNMLSLVAYLDSPKIIPLAEAFWPGPLTLVLPKKDIIPKETTGGLDTVAVRMPKPLVSRLIIKESGLPVAAPSANISGRPSPTKALHVMEDFEGRIDGVVDGGDTSIGIESTIVDLTTDKPCILRQGYIKKADLERVLGEEVLEQTSQSENQAPKAPGMKYKHYSPKAELILVEGKEAGVIECIREFSAKESHSGKKVAIICARENEKKYDSGKIYIMGDKSDGEEIMHNLYSVLRALDEDRMDVAFCESFLENEYSQVIMERLKKAGGEKTFRV